MEDIRTAHAKPNVRPGLKLKNMDEKKMHNLFLKNMAGVIEECKNPSESIENPWVVLILLYFSATNYIWVSHFLLHTEFRNSHVWLFEMWYNNDLRY